MPESCRTMREDPDEPYWGQLHELAALQYEAIAKLATGQDLTVTRPGADSAPRTERPVPSERDQGHTPPSGTQQGLTFGKDGAVQANGVQAMIQFAQHRGATRGGG